MEAPRKTTPEPVLVLLDNHGVYIPQLWCEDIDKTEAERIGISWDDVKTCQSGPDAKWYWEAWDSILDSASVVDEHGTTWTLHQNGDLWKVPTGFDFGGEI